MAKAYFRYRKEAGGLVLKELQALVNLAREHPPNDQGTGFLQASTVMRPYQGSNLPFYEFTLLVNGKRKQVALVATNNNPRTKPPTPGTLEALSEDTALAHLFLNTIVHRLKDLDWQYSMNLPATYTLDYLLKGGNQ